MGAAVPIRWDKTKIRTRHERLTAKSLLCHIAVCSRENQYQIGEVQLPRARLVTVIANKVRLDLVRLRFTSELQQWCNSCIVVWRFFNSEPNVDAVRWKVMRNYILPVIVNLRAASQKNLEERVPPARSVCLSWPMPLEWIEKDPSKGATGVSTNRFAANLILSLILSSNFNSRCFMSNKIHPGFTFSRNEEISWVYPCSDNHIWCTSFKAYLAQKGLLLVCSLGHKYPWLSSVIRSGHLLTHFVVRAYPSVLNLGLIQCDISSKFEYLCWALQCTWRVTFTSLVLLVFNFLFTQQI